MIVIIKKVWEALASSVKLSDKAPPARQKKRETRPSCVPGEAFKNTIWAIWVPHRCHLTLSL